MAIVSSGTITMTDIVNEFGGSAPHSLSEYYRGAGLVPDIGTNSSVPTSGTISFSDFYGAISAVYVTDVSSGLIPFKSGTTEGYEAGNIGEATDITVDFLSDATLSRLYQTNNFTVTAGVYFEVSGSYSNSGFDTVTFEREVSGGGTTILTLNRTDASYSTSAARTLWFWSGVSGGSETFRSGFTTNVTFL